MSFFIKSNKQQNHVKKRKQELNPKKKVKRIRKDEELSSSEDEQINGFKNQSNGYLSDDENETAQEKKVRLAKIYLEEIEREEKQRLEDKDISTDIISQRLKDDYLKHTGKLRLSVADNYTGVDQSNLTRLQCKQQKNTITCMCISANDKWIFSGGKNGVIIKWSLAEKKKLGAIPFIKTKTDRGTGHTSQITALTISSDSKFLATSDTSNVIHIWNPETLEWINTLKGHRSSVTGLVFKQNSHTLYSTSKDRSIRIWSLDEMAFVENLFGHQDTITGIDSLYTDRPVTSGGRDGTVRLWKISEESQLIYNSNNCSVDCIKLINEHNFITGDDRGQLSIWSVLKKRPLCVIKNAHGVDSDNLQPNWISAVTALTNTDLIASGSCDGFVRIWKLGEASRSLKLLYEIPIEGFINCLSFTSDGNSLLVACSRDHKFGRWKVLKQAKNCIIIVPLLKK